MDKKFRVVVAFDVEAETAEEARQMAEHAIKFKDAPTVESVKEKEKP